MSWRAFFPNDPISLPFVLILFVWFVSWLARLNNEGRRLRSVQNVMAGLDQCVAPLRAHQQWRDRQRLQGLPITVEPAALFDETWNRAFPAAAQAPAILLNHFRTIFVAGCEESQLDTAELNAQTCDELGNKSEQYRYELLLMLIVGALGTLVGLSRRLGYSAVAEGSLPPIIWGAFFVAAGGFAFLRHRQNCLKPALTDLRQRTTTIWIPKLYPTVAQRAAQWAIHTLHNAARVTDASAVIEKNAVNFVNSVESAKRAAEMFSEGIQGFSRGIDVSDRALQTAQTKIAQEVEKFAASLSRWGQFEDEIRRFYDSVQKSQQQIANEHRAVEALLSGYYNFLQRSTETLDKAASAVAAAAASLPPAFQESAATMDHSVAASQARVEQTVANLTDAMRATYQEHSVQLLKSIESVLQPVMSLEERLRALGVPFDQASKNMLEIATNIWRLNDTLTSEVRRFMARSADAR